MGRRKDRGVWPCREIGIDLGTTWSLVCVRGKGIVLREPTVAAIEYASGKVLQVGEAARQMVGRTPEHLMAVRPMAGGVIADYTITLAMLRRFLRATGKAMKPRLLIGVPSGITEVEERAVVEAGLQAGARRVYLMEEPLAAVIGAGLDAEQPEGHMVVDIGGGTTDVAVVALGGVVASVCLDAAGDRFDRELVRYIREKHHILVGLRTAEEVKWEIGRVTGEGEESAPVKGRCLTSGLPKEVLLTTAETAEAFSSVAESIVDAVHSVLERTPPELAADVRKNGILLTGGGSLLRGLDTLLSDRTGISVTIAEHPLTCVAEGLLRSLGTLGKRKDGVRNLARRRQVSLYSL